MAKKATSSSKKKKNQLPLLFAFLGVIGVAGSAFLYTLPAMSSKSSLESEVTAAEDLAERTREQLLQISSGDQSFDEMRSEAEIVDRFFPYFDAATVPDPLAEINLLYPALFEQAATDSGLGVDNVRAGWPAVAGPALGPDGVGAALLELTVRGDLDAPDRIVQALAGQGILATVISTDVAPVRVSATGDTAAVDAPADPNANPNAQAVTDADVDLIAASLRDYSMQVLLWYTLRPALDLSAATGGSTPTTVPVDPSTTAAP